MSVLDLKPHIRRARSLDLMPSRGQVVRVAGLTVESQGPAVGIGQLCQIHLADGRKVPAEVVGFQNQHRVLMPLESFEGISPRDVVVAHPTPRTIRLSPSLLGRVLDGLGRPIDNRGPLHAAEVRSLTADAPTPLSRPRIAEPLEFGLRVFDGLLTCGKGQRIGIFAGAGVGKSTLLGEIARSSRADVNVLALVGERGREVREFLEECLGPEGLARSVVVVATSDSAAIQRVKSAFLAVTIAEYFRDMGKDVLFMMDSVTRFAQAQREIGLAAGEPPTTKGYCPSVFSLLPKLTERMGYASRGSITGILTTLVEGDDLADPVADSVRSLLDGHIVLSRKLAELGHFPAVDILQSVSRLMPMVCSSAHLQAAQRMRAAWSTYQSAEDLINIGAYAQGSNSRIDKAVELVEPIRTFLTQQMGRRTSFSDTVQEMCRITEAWNFQTRQEDAPGAEPRNKG
jgi:flagellum-specific ATP synthase